MIPRWRLIRRTGVTVTWWAKRCCFRLWSGRSVIADRYVDPAFGTGAVKITPGHDPNDFEIGQRHHLEVIQVIGKDGQTGFRRAVCRPQPGEVPPPGGRGAYRAGPGGKD